MSASTSSSSSRASWSTRLLLGDLDASGTVSPARVYARRIRRLLPLSAVLLAGVAALSLLQFYVVWPTLLLALTWLWRRRRRSLRPALAAALVLILLASFLFNLQYPREQPAAAYFSLGLGAALALRSHKSRRKAPKRCAPIRCTPTPIAVSSTAAAAWSGIQGTNSDKCVFGDRRGKCT